MYSYVYVFFFQIAQNFRSNGKQPIIEYKLGTVERKIEIPHSLNDKFWRTLTPLCDPEMVNTLDTSNDEFQRDQVIIVLILVRFCYA